MPWLDIKSNHLYGATSGWFTGVPRPGHTGRSMHWWQIDLRNDAGQLACVSRIPVAILAPR
ncbi:hypothetical protein [Thauera sp. SDU_THAU2]|uniref:hypothetical protein n=1 Tax=Thauera sp. SDU_THAU2 TaxID=3136633 RepID=UPI0031203EDE